jgi:type I restriction enzyme, S subunit
VVQSGGTPLVSNKNFWGGTIAWYSSGELNALHTKNPERHISQDGLDSSNAKVFPADSLLIGMYDTAALKMSILDRDGAFNQAIAGVKPNEKIDTIFLLHAINAIKPFLLSLRRGVRQKNLSLAKIKEIELRVPSLREQSNIVTLLNNYSSQTQHLESLYHQKLAALDELKKSLLHQAFSGEL